MQVQTSYQLSSEYIPTGDQPQAIEKLVSGVQKNKIQTLLGVTGSGKTFTVANVIARTGKNTLVISHNKTLAAQLYSELKQFFPKNNVGYFVSYYDYYQPESYIAQTDTYIEKDTEINEKIEKMRLEATAMLLSGEPTIIVATVSCIYSLGNPKDWEEMATTIKTGMQYGRSEIIKRFVNARYERNDVTISPGTFRVKGDTIDVIPAYSQDVIRISLFGDEIEKIAILDTVSLKEKRKVNSIKIFPAKHYLVANDVRSKAVKSIRDELKARLPELRELEQQRLEMRTKFDLEMIEELGYCSGIENYSRHFDGRKPGEQAFCLIDFFGDDYLLVIDESHVTIPQLHGMYGGDYTRKKSLIEYGFRLPSAFDNRPLKFEEFEKYIKNTIFVSATPSVYEREKSYQIAEQLVRPTGLVDPQVEIRSTKNQMDDLIGEIKKKTEKNQRVLVTTLTKRMAEDLAEYLSKKEIRVRYLHAEIEGLQRTELIRQLRLGDFDVLVGINLLREGLDIPEVALVAILDADKEGFLRNYTSLIQTFGRAARNVDGAVILYADTITKSITSAIEETNRRRAKQLEYNSIHNITPRTIIKSIPEQVATLDDLKNKTPHDLSREIIEIEMQMKKYAEELDFENAIACRDRLRRIQIELEKKNAR
ncbi:excinuclease ABC subunit B [Candidatus Nitrosotenuis cloacae]|uniref:UvrABC system protein B n=1 Tax=Candidatus Nitrosotenuis cloacae TaxID=1603555 RepID=A0A3G1AZ11_9ARCH|nr:excinuclease ABC subunit UvrB [Candidatus Nitrosotenuis cloacae]AJZ75128.1 excinuclease ABC subunit B [Candidatus Nitrosotenuis cloacae]